MSKASLSKPALAAGLALAAVVALSACATPPAPALVAGAPVPLVKYDGNYQGRARLVTATAKTCPSGRYGVIEVADHMLNFAYLPDLIFVAPLADDGAIHATAGTATLDGKIADGTLTMTVKTPECESRYQASLIWNHS